MNKNVKKMLNSGMKVKLVQPVVGDSSMRKEEAGVKRFFRRVLYKLSGQKVIGFFLSASSILGIVAVSHFWKDLPNEIALKAIEAIKTLAITLFSVKGIQNIAGMTTNYLNGRKKNDIKF